MRFLLDTHIWTWSLLEPTRLVAPVAAALSDPDSELWLSPISVWELLMLIERKRVAVDEEPNAWVRRALRAAPLREAHLSAEIALESRAVRLPHADPADRFLVATAKVLDLTFVTADREILRGSSVSLLPNR